MEQPGRVVVVGPTCPGTAGVAAVGRRFRCSTARAGKGLMSWARLVLGSPWRAPVEEAVTDPAAVHKDGVLVQPSNTTGTSASP